MTGRVTALAALIVLAGCGEKTSNQPNLQPSGARLNLVNGAAASGAIQVYVDGSSIGNVGAATVRSVDIDPGAHTIEVRHSNGNLGFVTQLTVGQDHAATVIAFDSAGFLRQSVLADTNAVVPGGATKLRVAHFAQASSTIDIWRTQPDYGTPIRVQFPFNYLDVSPYLQSSVGDWQVFVSTPVINPGDPLPDTLAMTSALAVPDGKSRTVVAVDKEGGGVKLLVVTP